MTYYALFHCLAACCADMVVGGARPHRRAVGADSAPFTLFD